MAGLVRSFGSGAMTNSIADIQEAKSLLVIGSNTSATHPVIATRVRRAVMDGARLVVANPIEIPITKYATLHLRQTPGSDIALLMGLCRVLLDEGIYDKEYVEARCENFDEFKESLKEYDLDFVEKHTGVPAEKVVEAARVLAANRPGALLYAMGITQHTHGTDNVMATANLQMLLGNVGKAGGGVNPLRGQNNVQGACDMGALPNVFTGYQPVTDENVRKKFAAAWDVDEDMPGEIGLTIPKMFQGMADGSLKAMYLVGENPMLSDPDIKHVEENLKKLEFLVVQDIFPTESTPYAHVILPAAASMEKEGTFTNTERRVQKLNKVLEPAGESKPDWWITAEIAKRMGGTTFDYESADDILKEINKLTPSYTGITPERLAGGDAPQWPCPEEGHPGTPILHTAQFARGKGFLVPISYKGPAEMPDEEYPLVLTTTRSLFHYHTGTMTRKSDGLNTIHPENVVLMHPNTAQELELQDGEMVKVSSRRGHIDIKLAVSPTIGEGVVAMNFHFAEAPANMLTNPVLDPVSSIPEYKACAVRVEKAA